MTIAFEEFKAGLLRGEHLALGTFVRLNCSTAVLARIPMAV
ncbi:MAG TPA: hypothetical protein VGG99_16665 [Acetobacteraceae bacterium]